MTASPDEVLEQEQRKQYAMLLAGVNPYGDEGPARVSQVANVLATALGAEANRAPLGDVEASAALVLFLKFIRDVGPGNWSRLRDLIQNLLDEPFDPNTPAPLPPSLRERPN
jgi:hypothetical protein